MTKRSGSETRERAIQLKARFTDSEAALIKEQAARAGVSVAAVIRHAVLGQTPLRASRSPTVDQQLAAQLLAQLGRCASELREASDIASSDIDPAIIAATHRDMADMRAVLLAAMGRLP